MERDTVPFTIYEREEWQTAVRNFAKAILHGDQDHQEWLMEAAEAFVNGDRLPPPRDSKTR
jgi:hypothetical protein